MNYEELANNVVTLVGGKENIASYTHCITRLRFQIIDRSLIDEDKLKKVNGVKGIMDKGGIYQVIIGPDVDRAFEYVKKICSETEVKKNSAKKEKPWNIALNYISASLAPALPVLQVAGFGLVILSLLSTFGVLEKTSSTYIILNAFFNAGMYYLPVFIAVGAARRLKCNEIAAVFLALMTLHPDFVNAEVLKLFGVTLTKVTYNGNIIPMLLTIPVFAFLEHKFNDVLPGLVRNLFKYLFTFICTIPIMLFITGPIASVVTNWLANLLVLIADGGAVSMGIITLVSPILIMTGMHTVLLPVAFQEFSTLGYSILMSRSLAVNISIAGATLAVAKLAKNSFNKENALASGITALCGTTEPALYGTVIRFRKPFIAVLISCGINGFISGAVHLKLFAPAPGSLITLPAFMSGDYPSNFIWALVIAALSFSVAFALTYIFKIDEDEE